MCIRDRSIKSKGISDTWWGFTTFMFIGGMVLDWISGISEEHEQSKTNKSLK